jgi:hypothetical protein
VTVGPLPGRQGRCPADEGGRSSLHLIEINGFLWQVKKKRLLAERQLVALAGAMKTAPGILRSDRTYHHLSQ